MVFVSRGSALAIGVTFTVTSIAAVISRFAMRTRYGGVGIDDWLCLPALIFVLACCGIMIAGYATHSIGTHTPDVGIEVVTRIDPSQQLVREFEFVFYCMQVPALMFLKLSTLFLYRRLFRGKWFNIVSWILVGFSVVWAVAFFVAFAAACSEVTDHWLSVIALLTKCANTFIILLCQSVFDVAADIAILILPIPSVMQLRMPLRRRLGVLATLLLGALAVTCGIIRMVILGLALNVPLFAYSKFTGLRNDDVKGIVSVIMFWAMLEVGVAMVAICLPTLRPLLKPEVLNAIARGFRSLVSLRSRSNTTSSEMNDSSSSSAPYETKGTASLPFLEHATGMSSAYAERAPSADQNPTTQDINEPELRTNEVWIRKDMSMSTSQV